MTHELMKPFGFPPPWSNDEKTYSHARPTNVYDYESVLDYTYDTLQFGGMTVDQLNEYLEERQTRDRTFVGIQLHGFGGSAWVEVSITAPGGRHWTRVVCPLTGFTPAQGLGHDEAKVVIKGPDPLSGTAVRQWD